MKKLVNSITCNLTLVKIHCFKSIFKSCLLYDGKTKSIVPWLSNRNEIVALLFSDNWVDLDPTGFLTSLRKQRKYSIR